MKKTSFSGALSGILLFVLIIWGLEFLNYLLVHRLSYLGIYPRTVKGLPGILLTPLIHHGIEHVLMNTIPFVLLGVLISLKNHRDLFKVSIFIVIVGGLGVWIFGRPAYHAGASGLIFGYFGFLLARGWYAKDFGSVAIAIITVFFYGGMFLGILPVQTYISWESHLFGFIAGIMAARQFSAA
jgi:membrane associated rhomboid family serine protease